MSKWGERRPDLSDRDGTSDRPGSAPVALVDHSVPQSTWDAMTPGQKQAALLADALDYKRELVASAKAFPVNLENAPLHALFLRATDSIINQVLQIEANALHKPPSDDIEKIFEERQAHAIKEIERLGRRQVPDG